MPRLISVSRLRIAPALLVALTLGGTSCGSGSEHNAQRNDPLNRPVPRIGRGPAYRYAPSGSAAAQARPIAGLPCRREAPDRFGVHLEVFADRLDVVIPAGIGVAPPRIRHGAYVTGGPCRYPASTLEPTGLIEVDGDRTLTLGQFFEIWGQPLGRTRLLRFPDSGRPVAAFVDGRRWQGDPRAIPLRRHAAIVLEVGAYFPPSKRYLFPPGL